MRRRGRWRRRLWRLWRWVIEWPRYRSQIEFKTEAASIVFELWDADTRTRVPLGRFIYLVREALHTIDQLEDAT
jgi:hypothetical protein